MKIQHAVLIFPIMISLVQSYLCDRFSLICPAEFGKSMHNMNGANTVKLDKNGAFYSSFTMPANTQSVDIDLSVGYGSVEIYVAKNREPKVADYDVSNIVSGEKDFLRLPGSGSSAVVYNILVRAWSAAELGIMLVKADTVVSLIPGQSQKLRVDAGHSSKLSFQVANTKTVAVLLTSYSSVSPVITLARPNNAVVDSSVNITSGYITFNPLPNEVGKTFTVTLSSANNSVFSVLAKNPGLDTAPAGLMAGAPQFDFTGKGTEQYYVLQVPKDITGDVVITVDPIHGDADLFVNPSSQGFYHRTKIMSTTPDRQPVWTSQRPSGPDSVVIAQSDAHYISNGVDKYFITVYGYVASEFNVRVSVAGTVTTLVEQFATTAAVKKESYQYYRFYDTAPSKGVVFNLNPTTGDADLFVGCSVLPTANDKGFPSKLNGHWNFSSQSYLEDTVVIATSDPHNCAANSDVGAVIYYIAVYGYYDSTYTLTATHTGGVVNLVAGVPVTNLLFKKTAQLYQIRVGYEAADLKVQLSPEYGDVDLYVRLGDTASVINYDYKSSNLGRQVDQVVVPETSICQNCWVSILAYGYATARYSLVASFSDGTITLLNGVPQKGSVDSQHIQYYSYVASADCIVDAVVTLTSGNDPALYMSTVHERPNGTTSHTVKYESSTVSLLSLPDVHSGQIVYVGVGGAGSNSTYSVRVRETYPAAAHHAPTLMTLKEGQPQSDAILFSAPSAWLYYYVAAPPGHETISVRSISLIGQVDLFSRKCRYNSLTQCAQRDLPNATYYSLSTVDADQDIINIHRNDENADGAIYLVGVQSTSYTASFQISFGFENTILDLQPGVSVLDHVGVKQTDYFSFYFDQVETDIHFALTPISGDPDLYISTTLTRPGPDNSTWQSFDFGSDTLTISPKSDHKACTGCMYYIAVYGTRESTYTISVSLKDTMKRLVDGVPSSGSVSVLTWQYYSFYLVFATPRDLKITLTSYTGNADLYVTMDGTLPKWSHYDYHSSNWVDADSVTIQHSDAKYVANARLIVGIYGMTSADYSLTLVTASTASLMQMGVVQSGSVSLHGNNMYKVLLSQSGSTKPYTLRFSVTPYSGHVSLCVSCRYDVLPVTNSTAMWSLPGVSSEGAALDVESLSAADQGCLHGATFYATVHGDSAAAYSLMANIVSNNSVPVIIPNVASPGSVPYQHLDYYTLKIGKNNYEDITLLLTVLQGEVDLYVSPTYDARPVVVGGVVKSFKFASTNVGADQLVLTHDKIQDLCVKREFCYVVVAVYGAYANSAVSSRYSLLSTNKDSTITLASGIPRSSSVAQGRYQYFKYSITIPHKDVVISVTPISGDPDVYVGVGIKHPDRYNYTFAQSQIGADALTIQYQDLYKHCTPDYFHSCDITIGVFGWQNSTFSIVASLDEGFISPILLLDQAPQNGAVGLGGYVYYKYYVSVDPPTEHNTIPVAIKFTLTPTDGGDPDLFAIFANRTEPGKNAFHYRSNSYSSISDVIEVSNTMPHYCYNCAVYLSVFGFTKSAFTIQASSTGLTQLQSEAAVGDRVAQDKYNYYTFYNNRQFGELKFTLTTISGDADIFIVTRSASDTKVTFPSKTAYTWRSMNTAADTISIAYDDPHYCFDCEYVVGIMGFRNSTYTLLAVADSASVIRLSQNRPQSMSLSEGEVQYFSTTFLSSVDDITISLTSLNTGVAELFATVYNATNYYSAGGGDRGHPDPTDPSSYQYTTYLTEDNHIYIPGPHAEVGVIVVAVWARNPITFTIIASSSHNGGAVLLQAGVPQSHFVELHQNELFKFFPSADEDLRITVTARSGDPDLFVSTQFTSPHCTVGDTQWAVTCSNFTWSSRMFSTDQIVLSRDYPCSSVISSTYVDPSCNVDTSFIPSNGQPVYINVFGYQATKFTLLVAPVGASVQLLAGQPQISSTTQGYICDKRSEKSGACESSAAKKTVQVSYFAFHVALPSDFYDTHHSHRALLSIDGEERANNRNGVDLAGMMTVSDVMLTVMPNCNASRIVYRPNSTVATFCPPGCDCNPLSIYVNSCPVSKCTLLDRKPSELNAQHQTSMQISTLSGTTLFITSQHSGYCDPVKAQSDCAYFIAVAAAAPTGAPTHTPVESASFTFTARTPGDITLVPCDPKAYPDGIKVSSADVISSSALHYFELCGSATPTNYHLQAASPPNSQNEFLQVELEQCYGHTTLLACADDGKCDAVLPSSKSWAYYADSKQTCTHNFIPHGRDVCTPVSASEVAPKPSLKLPPRNGNYFLATNGTNSMYVLTVANTVNNGVRAAPKLVTSGMQTKAASKVTVDTVSGNSATLTWHTSQVVVPGVPSPIFATFMRYKVHIIDTTAVSSSKTMHSQLASVRLDTMCGLAYAGGVLMSGPKSSVPVKYLQVVPVTPNPNTEVNSDLLSHAFKNLLLPGHSYKAIVTASCDSNCLRQVSIALTSREKGSALTSCSASGQDECKTQSFVYSSVEFTTADTADAQNTDNGETPTHHSSSSQYVLEVVAIVLVVVVVVAAIVAGLHYRKNVLGDTEYEVAMGDSAHDSEGKLTEMVGSKHSSSISFPSDIRGGSSSSSAGGNVVLNLFASASNFLGNLTSGNTGGASAHGVEKSYGEVSVKKINSSSSNSSSSLPPPRGGTSQSLFGRMTSSAYKPVEDDDEVTEIQL